jgi:transcriptional regulator GlxA family with amidase domain
VDEDLGRAIALEVARWLVLFLRRPGGQSQFSAQLGSQLAERDALRELQGFIADHPAENLSVPSLARRAGMSTRNFRPRVSARPVVDPRSLRGTHPGGGRATPARVQ